MVRIERRGTSEKGRIGCVTRRRKGEVGIVPPVAPGFGGKHRGVDEVHQMIHVRTTQSISRTKASESEAALLSASSDDMKTSNRNHAGSKASMGSTRKRLDRSFGPSFRPASSVGEVQASDTYEVRIEKPLGVKFTRGKDGGAYVSRVDDSLGNIDESFEIGDKIVAISASFGPDIWAAENYGQIMYAIKTRSGGLYFKMEKKYGDLSFMEKPQDDDFRRERAGGNYGAGTKELQLKNYEEKKKRARERVQQFEKGLQLFNQKKYEDALIVWEDVLGQEPPNYMGDRFERVTDVYLATQYNIACCYASLGKLEEGLDALEDVLFCGYDDYKKVRTDPNLAPLRENERFTPMINKYDEPWINENAFKALKGIFGK